jgi:hypothetical protein
MMATTTRVLDAYVNGVTYTGNANDALEALDTCHSGSTPPTDELANGKLWLDTSSTPSVLKVYDNASWNAIYSGRDNFTVNGDLIVDSTGAVKVPVGTGAERPTPVTGQIRFNTTVDSFEGYDGSAWVTIAADLSGFATSTSGTLTDSTLNGDLEVDLGGDATGDIYYRGALGTFQRLAVGTEGQALKVASGLPSWSTSSAAAQTAAPTLGTPYRASTLSPEVTIAVSNFSSYVFPTLTYYITDNAGNIVSSLLEATAAPLIISVNDLAGTSPHTVHVTAKEFGKTVSSESTASIPANTGSFTYRYYRISNVFANQGVAEWRLYTDYSQQGTDVSISAITASYTRSATYSPDKAHDGSESTMWWTLGASGAQWLRFDLGASPPTIKSMSISAESSSFALVDAVLEASNTGAFAGEEVTLVSDVDVPAVAPLTLYLG